ncbi:hypothetical protein [Lentibacillus daqui]|uniref:hypothetical protein n=1 Tax=Lentibacillus daqui TaxID=2911514 RepID=UPI0022B08630|nr:hypothetical protein [Lentibacillus daqui]
MKIKIAVFGRKELVERALVYTEGQDDVEIVPFIYTDAKETADLIEKAVMCDIYLFAGALPFMYAREKIIKKRLPAVQVAFDEYMLLTSFYRLRNMHNRLVDRVSIDAPERNRVSEVSTELAMHDHHIYTYSYGDQVQFDINQIVAFHEQLWQQGKIDYVLTSIEEVEEQLTACDVTAYCMKVPKVNIANAINQAKAKATLNQTKSTQICAGFVRPKQETEEKTAKTQSDDLQQILSAFGSQTHSAVLENGNRFALIGTRELLNYLTNHYRDFPLLREIEQKLRMPVDIGFGLGLTVKQAEDNALLALETCQSTEGSACYLINDRQETIGPLGVEKHVDTSQLYRALIHKAKLNNELSYNFIDFIKLRNNEPFSANDIAKYYRVTKRSAERTIYKLLSGEVIKVVGEEKPYQKGRPRKLFKITI